MDDSTAGRLADAAWRNAANEQFAAAVASVFAAAAARDGGAAARQLARADLVAEWRDLRARQAAKYGDPAEMMARLEARGAGRLSARLWC
jgi:hypothetical protein